jgi:hypothetical protein
VGLLRGPWIGWEQQPVLAGHAAQRSGAKARLDANPPQQRLERPHPGHPLEAEHHAALQRHGAGREAGPAAARYERHVVLVAPGDGAGDLLGGGGQHDSVGAASQTAVLGRVGQVRG